MPEEFLSHSQKFYISVSRALKHCARICRYDLLVTTCFFQIHHQSKPPEFGLKKLLTLSFING